jgi:hypothetical protein
MTPLSLYFQERLAFLTLYLKNHADLLRKMEIEGEAGSASPAGREVSYAGGDLV